MKFGIMFARQRSGTGALGSVLDQHPNLHYLGEVFHPNNLGQEKNFFTFQARKFERSPEFTLPSDRLGQFEEFITEFIEPGLVPIADIKYSSVHHLNSDWHPILGMPRIVSYVRERELPIVHLTRRNFVQTYISGLLAEKNRIWHAQDRDEIKVTRISVDPNVLLRYLHATAEEVAKFKSWIKNYKFARSIDYEDIFEDNAIKQSVLDQLSDLFQVDAFVSALPGFVKQAPKELSDSIENFDEIRQFISNTKFAWMLHSER